MPSWSVSQPRTINIADDVRTLDVRITTGRLSVVGADGPPRIEIAQVAAAPVDVKSDGDKLSINHGPSRGRPGILAPLWWWMSARRYRADVSIAVPYATVCNLWLGSGSLVVSTVHGDVVADCVSGRVTLLGIIGQVRSRVVSGPVEALGCAGDIHLETVSGEIVLADSSSSRVHAQTVSGSLIADLDNPPSDSHIDLETISGEITIRVREDSDLRVRMNAAHGRVSSDFPGLSVAAAWGASVAGTLGIGTGNLVASAVGGNISLLRRPVDASFAAEGDVPITAELGDPS
jgi:hypothetical protein